MVRVLGFVLAAAAAASAEPYANPRVAVLEAWPDQVPRGEELELRGETRGDYRAPELIVIAPDGRTYLNGDQDVAGRKFVFRVRFTEGPGRYRLEVMARSPNALRSAARFDVYYARPPDRPEPPPEGPPIDPDHHERLLEKRLYAMFNELRASLRLDPFAWDETVAHFARVHAGRMAQAGRRFHRFGGVGVVEMLENETRGDGAAERAARRPWTNVTQRRPFDRQAPEPPGPRVYNHVVPFLLETHSLEKSFEEFFVREPAFRICAADPHGAAIAIGAARRKGGPLFVTVCFVQVNDNTILRERERLLEDVFAHAVPGDPDALRLLGVLAHPRGADLAAARLGDAAPETAGAAWDALLLLDEPRARKVLERLEAGAGRDEAQRRWGRAANAWRPLRHAAYDLSLPRRAEQALARVRAAAAAERAEIAAIADDAERARREAEFARRAEGALQSPSSSE